MIATVHGGVNVNDEHITTMKNIESPGMLELLFFRTYSYELVPWA